LTSRHGQRQRARRGRGERGLTLASAAVAALAGSASAGVRAFEYAYDDGMGNVNVGPPGSFDAFPNTDLIWGNVFNPNLLFRTITELRVSVGTLSETPRDAEAYVWAVDGSADAFDPAALGAPISSATTQLVGTGLDEFLTIDVPDASVGAAQSFFVAVVIRGAVPGGEAAARLDPSSRADRSWLLYSPDFDASDVGGTLGFATPMDDPQFVPIPGAFMVRAVAVPGPGAFVGAVAVAGLVNRRRRGQ
jgi:hypothetical protein